MENITPSNKIVDMTAPHYAGFWIRLLAMIIDGIILGIISKILFGDTVVQTTNGSITMQFNNAYTLVPLIYTLACWMLFSATPGKYLLGLRIVDEEGNKLSPAKAIIRYLGYIVSSIILCIGYLMIGFSSKKQGLHDLIAKTYVVHKK